MIKMAHTLLLSEQLLSEQTEPEETEKDDPVAKENSPSNYPWKENESAQLRLL